MSQSLREQLVQAGLATEEQAAPKRNKAAAKGHKKSAGRRRGSAKTAQAKGKRGAPSPAQSAGERAATAPAGEAAESKASKRQRKREAAAAVAAIVAEHGRKRATGEVPYRFSRGRQIKETWVSQDEHGALARGELALIGSQGRYALLPAEHVPAVRAVNPSAVLAFAEAGSTSDEEYGPPVPDDLIW